MLLPAADSSRYTPEGAHLLQRALSVVCTGYFYNQNPYLSISKTSPLSTVFDGYHVSRIMGLYKEGANDTKDGYHVVARGIIQEPTAREERKFKSLEAGNAVPDRVKTRFQRGEVTLISDVCDVSGLEFVSYLLRLPFRNPQGMLEQLKTFLTGQNAFSKDTSIYGIKELQRMLSRFREDLGYRVRRDAFKNANTVIYNPAKMSGSTIYDNPNELRNMINDASAKIRDLNIGLVRGFDGRYAVIVPAFVKAQMQELLAFSFMNNQGFLNEGFDPSMGMNRIPYLTKEGNVFTDGSNYYCEDLDSQIHVSGTASTLTDLTISKNVTQYDLSPDILSSGYQTVEISSAATDTFTLKANDVIIVKDKFFLKRKDRPTGYTLGLNDVSDSPLCFIVQEDVTSTTKKAVVKVSPDIYDGVNAKLTDLVATTQVSVIPNHRKILICPMVDTLFSRIFPASTGSRGYVINDMMDSYTGLNGSLDSGIAVVFGDYEDTNTRDLNIRFGLRSYYTMFSFQHESAQVIIPVDKPTASQLEPIYRTKAVTP